MFNTALCGYNRHQVNQTMEKLADQLHAAVRRTADAERQLAQAAEDAQVGFGGRIEQMIRLAEREAAQARATAGQDAVQILDAAREEADKLRAAAESEAAATLQQARTQAHDTRQTAEHAIAEQRDRAHTELGQLHEARAHLCAELTELREGLVAILNQVQQRTESSQLSQTAPQPRQPDPREAVGGTIKTG
jgi:cell division septum initiation protein DivIVA